MRPARRLQVHIRVENSLLPLWGPGNHDTMRCEYMMQYNSSDTGSYKVFVPEPRKPYICDDGK